ncbi:hypothetical protein, partial [Escherichia coli]|uniref:hypothetical protein n=1 Tax=Escherichia coli TaxID=562 RepID=UPI003CE5BB75
TAKVTAVDVATISAFCSLSIGIGLTTLTGVSLLVTPQQASSLLHLQPAWSQAVGVLLLSAVAGYGLWGSLSKNVLEIRGWALR